MFRSGRIGIALLILRLCLVGTLGSHAYRFATVLPSFWTTILFVVVATALALGAMTTVACGLYCVAEIVFMFSSMGFDATVITLSMPVAIALALLGPGAYSIDARVFGRRIIVLPPDDRV